jgi:hypothetical protein
VTISIRQLLVAGAFLLLMVRAGISTADAAMISADQTEGSPYIIISGAIELADYEKFKAQADKISNSGAVVFLDSEGGEIIGALSIGELIRERGFTTAVIENRLCASACALVWLAGKNRYWHPSGKLGFHAAYHVTGDGLSESGSANALIGAYLAKLGYGYQTIYYVTSAPPTGMAWLSPAKSVEVGITFETIPAKAGNYTETEVGYATNPIEAATRFYSALGQANGGLAAAFVVTEKRGIGPFNEQNITNFFGSLSERLAVKSVSSIENDRVEVRYHYRKATGEVCDGVSIVSTRREFGRTLIAGIKAPNGC